MQKTVYFDHAATTAIDRRVLEEMIPYLTGNYANASSLYSLGKTSKNAINLARQRVANAINCNPDEVYIPTTGSPGTQP